MKEAWVLPLVVSLGPGNKTLFAKFRSMAVIVDVLATYLGTEILEPRHAHRE